MNITIDQNSLNKIQQKVFAEFEHHYANAIREELSLLLMKPWLVTTPHGVVRKQPAGAIREMITERINDVFLTDEFQQKIDTLIEEKLAAAVGDMIKDAVAHGIRREHFMETVKRFREQASE